MQNQNMLEYLSLQKKKQNFISQVSRPTDTLLLPWTLHNVKTSLHRIFCLHVKISFFLIIIKMLYKYTNRLNIKNI